MIRLRRRSRPWRMAAVPLALVMALCLARDSAPGAAPPDPAASAACTSCDARHQRQPRLLPAQTGP